MGMNAAASTDLRNIDDRTRINLARQAGRLSDNLADHGIHSRYSMPARGPRGTCWTYRIWGNTYPVRDLLRAAGFRWNARFELWEIVARTHPARVELANRDFSPLRRAMAARLNKAA